MNWLFDISSWIFNWRFDEIVLPWLDANKITFGFLLYLPYRAYLLYRENRAKIIQADKKYDKIESGNGKPLDEPKK